MSSFLDLVKARRSARRFTEKELSDKQVEQLMRVALMSPSSKNKRPWEFVLVDDKERLAELCQCKDRGAEPIANAPLAIVVLADPMVSDVWIEDASVATTLIMMEAEELGLGACWIQVRERCMVDGKPAGDIVRGLLGIPGNFEVLSIVAVGHKAVEKPEFDDKNMMWEKLHINKFKKEQTQ